MKIKESLAYEGRKPQNRRKLSLIVDEIEIDDKYLIVDLYSKKTLTYRIVITQTGYMHYDYQTEKTDQKKMYENSRRNQIDDAYITDDDLKKLKKFGRNIKEYYDCYNKSSVVQIIQSLEENVYRYLDIRKTERNNKEKEELFKLIPGIPEPFYESIERNADKTNIIYYKRHGIYADYTCCQCGKQYTLRNKEYEGIEPVKTYPVPKQSDLMQCPECKKYGTLLHLGRAKTTHYEFNTILYQVAADTTLIARHFMTIVTRDEYGPYKIHTAEEQRVFMRPGMTRQYYHNTYSDTWHTERNICTSQIFTLYEYGYESIKNSCLKYIPHDMYKICLSGGENQSRRNMSKLETLISYARCTQLETLYKVGLTRLCSSLIYRNGQTRDIDKKQKELHKILRITKQQLNYLMMKPQASSFNTIEMIHFAEKNNIPVSRYERLKRLWDSNQNNLEYLIKFQSFDKLYNTLKKYKDSGHYNTTHNLLREYADYIREREAQGDDLSNSVYLRPRDLYETYTRLRLEAEQKRSNKYINDMMIKYPDIKVRSAKIPKKYTWQQSGLIIRPARDTEEIVIEGRTLHHCVGSDSQRYMKNFNEGKAWILVIRHDDAPDVPYITVELQDNNVKQWYGEHDTKPDEDIIDKFLDEYIEHINGKRVEVQITA